MPGKKKKERKPLGLPPTSSPTDARHNPDHATVENVLHSEKKKQPSRPDPSKKLILHRGKTKEEEMKLKKWSYRTTDPSENSRCTPDIIYSVEEIAYTITTSKTKTTNRNQNHVQQTQRAINNLGRIIHCNSKTDVPNGKQSKSCLE